MLASPSSRGLNHFKFTPEVVTSILLQHTKITKHQFHSIIDLMLVLLSFIHKYKIITLTIHLALSSTV